MGKYEHFSHTQTQQHLGVLLQLTISRQVIEVLPKDLFVMSLDTNCVDTIRVLSADMVEKANSGHPGAPMGCAPITHVLFSEMMNYSPKNPTWANRDRFVLSNGHSCALLYAMLHLSGYSLTLEDLKQFRQLNSLTPGRYHQNSHNILTY